MFGRIRRDCDRIRLIAALIAVVIIGAVTKVGTSLSGQFNNIAGNVAHP